MARAEKRRIEGATGRTTPKGTTADTRPREASAPAASSRYTPPVAASYHAPSPMWVPVLMFSLFAIGILMIFLNYTNTLPGAPSGYYMLGGLLSILLGIITATQLR
jgi:hypothetical protein